MDFRIFLLLISVFLISSANAVPIKGLYSAEVNLPVGSSEAKMLDDAFSMAAEEVLVKVSGDKAAMSSSLLEQAKKQASTWVAQHSVMNLTELLPWQGDLVPGRQIKVTFYQSSIDNFLSQNNLAVWGENRPSVLVWLATESNGFRTLSGSNAPSVVLNEFAQAANAIGVPVYAPLLDEVDKRNLAASDVWGFFEDNILKASQRYQTDSVAALRVSQYADSAAGNLLILLKSGDVARFSLNGDSTQAVVEQASVHLAKVFSSRYASVRNSRSSNILNIQVAGISSYTSMSKVQTYLESISVVRDVRLLRVEGEKIEFLIEIDGDRQKLFNSISLSRLLVNAPLNALDPDANRIVSYQYSGVN
ncbi:DUF2066 domain-containing protein [Marinomonas sp. A79]|uniref:DUF2066 domain-containing protein n=1 Tax=Marinomonas vulgaris TaxID=2823372 RepID=A0ABS5H8F6_9GAMM|nr:DUF2066 domain-containing protein [Marinomonas vulgaris]MBR7887870.1 DUF2066 domain-containing protein [Marinomonas vulgaris]